METAALEEGEPGAEDEPGADEVRPSDRPSDRYSRFCDRPRWRAAFRSRRSSPTCGVVVLIYLLGKLAFRMRDVLLMIAGRRGLSP